jgi:phage replication-related protein YjqB (UPF0714/DUF867 family)
MMPVATPINVTAVQVATDIDGKEERCAVDAAIFAALGLNPLTHDFTKPGNRPQIHVVVASDPARYALYTIAKLAGGANPVEMGPGALERPFGTNPPASFAATVDDNIQLWSGFSEHSPLGTGAFLVAIAPHGGLIEEWTDEQVEEVDKDPQLTSLGMRRWFCKGTGPAPIGAKDRWHITSNDISEISFPLLKDLIDVPFTHAVSFHGFGSFPGDVWVGGRASAALKQRFVNEIQAVSPQLVVGDNPPSALRGNEMANIVNRLARGNGIQIEQSKNARDNWNAQIAQAVASVYVSLPDVYVRDNVSDAGAPHTGPLSLSPDIIVKQAPVMNPQGAYGENSGTKSDVNLSDDIEYGQYNYLYVRVMNRGMEAAQQMTAEVFWSEVATLITPNQWNSIGQTTIQSVPPGDVLTVSNPITWLADDIPAEGHYCFVARIGTELDPMPDHTAIQDWDEFIGFIRHRNNATWRNFNVVDINPNIQPLPGVPEGFTELRFLAPGAPDQDRPMRLELGAELPDGAELLLDTPLEMLERMERHPENLEVDEERRTARLRIDPYRGQELGEILFRAGSRNELRLLVRIPEQSRKEEHELFARQLYEGVEVGRVTWRLRAQDRAVGIGRWRRNRLWKWLLLGACAVGLAAAIGLWTRRRKRG